MVYLNLLLSPFILSSARDALVCKLLLLRTKNLSTPPKEFIYWTEGGRLVVGTMIVNTSLDFPCQQAMTYGISKDGILGMYAALFSEALV